MKKAVLFSFLFYVLLILKLPFYFASMAFLLSGLLVYLSYNYYLHLMRLREARNRIENIYLVSDSPKGKRLILNDLKGFVINVPYREVLERKKIEERFLKVSGNPFFLSSTKKGCEIKVIGFIYQDADFINESWEEYNYRVIESVKEDRLKRHKALKNYDPVFYDQYCNYQKGIIWKM